MDNNLDPGGCIRSWQPYIYLTPPPPFPDPEKDQPHGPLIGFGWNSSSFGMTVFSQSSSKSEVRWQTDGSVLLVEAAENFSGKREAFYRVPPETAEKLRELVAASRLAALDGISLQTQQTFTDAGGSCFFSLRFDDSAIGGSPTRYVSIPGVVVDHYLPDLRNEVDDILQACKDAGECVGRDGAAQTDGAPDAGASNGSAAVVSVCTACGFRSEEKRKFCPECGAFTRIEFL